MMSLKVAAKGKTAPTSPGKDTTKMTASTKPMTWAEYAEPSMRGQGAMITPAIAAEALGVTPQTVCRLLRLGQLNGVKPGKSWFISRDWFMGYLGLED